MSAKPMYTAEREKPHPDERRDLAQLVERLRSARGDARFVQYRMPAPAVTAAGLVTQGDESFFWAPQSAEQTVGIDCAKAYTHDGPDRFSAIREQVERDIDGAVVVDERPEFDQRRTARDRATTLRVYGGFAFGEANSTDEPRSSPERIWTHGFGSARFVLPRFSYERQEQQATLSLTLSAAELKTRDVAEHWLERALALRLALRSHTLQRAREERPTSVNEVALAAWHALVEDVLEEIQSGSASKIVVARCNEYRFAEPVSLSATLDALMHNAHGSTRFAFRRGGDAFVGATPERLINKHGLAIETEALAGTFRTAASAFAEELLRSPKEHSEHAPVLEAIIEQLAPLCSALDYPARPEMRELPDLLHLRTPIQGKLREPVHVLSLVERLHPTPAVGGVPREAAVRWLELHEPVRRGWYSGPIGWFDAHGDGEFNVALRAGLLSGEAAYLYAGAGIVPGSEPAGEYAETELKLRALRSCLRFE